MATRWWWWEGTQTRQYMRRNNTDYRTKLQAVFLAAIMVVSVVGMSVAFAGAGAAAVNLEDEPPGENYNLGFNETAELEGSTVYQGQIIAVNVSDINASEDEDVRLRQRLDGGDTNETRQIETVGANQTVIFDTEDRVQGDYFLENESGDNQTDTFEILVQELDADFDDDEVEDESPQSETEIEFDSDIRTEYDIVVNAEGDLDEDELFDIFNFSDDPALEVFRGSNDSDGLTDLEADDLDDDYDLDPDEAIVLRNVTDDDYDLDFDGIDEGDYDFNFDVADTTAGDDDSITVEDRDIDAEFADGVFDAGEGDISEIEFEVEDTDEVWLQIGSEDSEFIDVLYIEVDDEDEPVEITVNNRLLGAHATDDGATGDPVDKEFVYDMENVDEFDSGIHGGFSDAAAPAGDTQLFGDDGFFGSPLENLMRSSRCTLKSSI